MKKSNRWSDYELIDLNKLTGDTIITFGTSLFLRKDKQAIRIVFPTGQQFTFCPADEVAENDLLGG